MAEAKLTQHPLIGTTQTAEESSEGPKNLQTPEQRQEVTEVPETAKGCGKAAGKDNRSWSAGSPGRYQAAAGEAENTAGSTVFSDMGNILFSCPAAKLQLQKGPVYMQGPFMFYEKFYESMNKGVCNKHRGLSKKSLTVPLQPLTGCDKYK